MNIEDRILAALLHITDKHLCDGNDQFDEQEIETELMGDPSLKDQPHPVLRLVLKPFLTQELRELLQKVFRNDPEAKRLLTLKLTKGAFPKAVLNYIIGALAKGLKHQYDGPREVLKDVLMRTGSELRHEYTRVIEQSYQYAMENLANPEYTPRTPKLQRGLHKKKKDDGNI